MKLYFKNYLKTFIFLLISLIIFSFIIVIIRFNSQIKYKTIRIISLIGSSLLFLLASIFNGKLNKKRGLINGIIMTSIYLLIVLIFSLFNQTILISSIIIKSTLIIIGNIIGVNL